MSLHHSRHKTAYIAQPTLILSIHALLDKKYTSSNYPQNLNLEEPLHTAAGAGFGQIGDLVILGIFWVFHFQI